MGLRANLTSIKNLFSGNAEINFVYSGLVLIYKSITQFVTDYVSRVTADGGFTESTNNVKTLMQSLRDKDVFDEATFVMIPSGTKSGRVYSELNANGDLTFTRASTATRVNSAGLIETSPSNLLQRSEEFDNAAWTAFSATVTANASISPNGTITAERLNISSGGVIRQTIQMQSGVVGTISLWVKKAPASSASHIRITTNNTVAWNTGLSQKIILTDNWQRATLTGVLTTTGSQMYIYIGSLTESQAIDVDCLGNVDVFGCQLEIGSTATDYVATTDRLNHPRIDHSSGVPALLLEPQRTNLFLQSQNISSSSWVKLENNGIIPDVVSGFGNIFGIASDKVTFYPLTTGSSRFQQGVFVTSGLTYTMTVYIRSLSGVQEIRMYSAGNTTSKISVGESPTRLTLTFSVGSSATFNSGLEQQSTYLRTTGEFLITGFQIEAGSFATFYIPTTTATVTRISDSYTRNNVFTNNLISSQGGTWFVELVNNVLLTRSADSTGLFVGDNTTPSNGFTIKNNGTNARLSINKVIAGTPTTLYTTTANNSKIVIKWNGTTADVFENGVKVVSATSFTTTVMENLNSNNADVTKNIKQMKLSNKPLTDAQCVSLTQ